MVKNLPADTEDAQETGSITGSGRSPGEGNGKPLSVLDWTIPWTEAPGGPSPRSCKESDTTERLSMQIHIEYPKDL